MPLLHLRARELAQKVFLFLLIHLISLRALHEFAQAQLHFDAFALHDASNLLLFQQAPFVYRLRALSIILLFLLLPLIAFSLLIQLSFSWLPLDFCEYFPLLFASAPFVQPLPPCAYQQPLLA